VLAKRCKMEPLVLCQTIRKRTSQLIAAHIVAKLLQDEDGKSQADVEQDAMVRRALQSENGSQVQCRISLTSDIVAIGAPVETYFPAVGELLHCGVCIPAFSKVANAVGAVVGGVVMPVKMLVLPEQEAAGYRVHAPHEMRHLENLSDALTYAEEQGRALALSLALAAGADDVRLDVQRRDHRAPVGDGWGDDLYIGTDVTVTAIGRPRLTGG